MENPKLKIIFLGTPRFAAIILEKLIAVKYDPILVITSPDKPVGRKQIFTPPPVKITSLKHRIPIDQPAKIQNSKFKIQNSAPDIIITAAYGQILPRDILDIPKYGSLNIHPSLLPKYRGPSPIQTTILNGDEETGVTIIKMDEKVDHGPIVSFVKSSAKPLELTYEELADKLANESAKLLLETIPKWINKEINTVLQDDSKATFTKILRKEDGLIDWKKSATEIERQIRGLNPWPGTFTNLDGKTLKILEAEISTNENQIGTGKIFLENDRLTVKAGQNGLIVRKLQLEGGKPLEAPDFLKGHKNIIGKILT